ncbi:hypothetical protein VNO77_23267 [Canavalia gladiata]|uniref:Uncharacterized protein n=1 Tax=Canavalia gladiata TaxID=3824 RepID=A0AAN9QBC8_CANGL
MFELIGMLLVHCLHCIESCDKVLVMETHKEKREEIEKEEEKRNGSRKINNEENERKGDTMSKRVIRESIVSGGGKNNERAQAPQDILAFSRSVRNVDSLLE